MVTTKDKAREQLLSKITELKAVIKAKGQLPDNLLKKKSVQVNENQAKGSKDDHEGDTVQSDEDLESYSDEEKLERKRAWKGERKNKHQEDNINDSSEDDEDH